MIGFRSYLDDTIDVDTINKKTNTYLEFFNEPIPSKLVQIRQNDKPCFNTELRREMRKRDRLRRVAMEKTDQHHVNK